MSKCPPSPLDQHLGQRMRARRLELGMTQEILAKLLGVALQQVAAYEAGQERIAASRLYDIATALQAPVPRFFAGFATGGRAERRAQILAFDEERATNECAALANLFGQLDGSEPRNRVLELTRALAEAQMRQRWGDDEAR